jgi:sugar phosphate isomerase/epimerase
MKIGRRDFLAWSLLLNCTALAQDTKFEELPLKFGHRQANMVTEPGPQVFELARRISGISGVELQMIWKGQDLSNREMVLAYKKEANRWAIEVPSIAGVWKRGQTIFDIRAAEQALSNAIHAAELLGASVILVALFKPNCPDMSNEASWEPVVGLFKKLSPKASDVGVVFGLETSLAPAEDKKLIDLIGESSVGIYYDATNVETYHPGEAVSGIELLGSRIVQCHLKNGARLLNEKPWKVDWTAALKAYQHIHYSGWYVFETTHSSPEQCIEATETNIQFVKQNLVNRSYL